MSAQDFARLFDAQYRTYQADLPLWERLASHYGAPILELGCGPGRVLISLARAGYRLAGVDDDVSMLARAKSKLGPDLVGRVTLIYADIRRLPLRAGYRLAIAPCHTMAYFDEAEVADGLRSAAAALAPGGGLALDLPTPTLEGLERVEGIVDTFHEPERGSDVQVTVRQRLDRAQRRVHVTWGYLEMFPDGGNQHIVQTVTYHLRTRPEVRGLLEAAGLRLVNVLGDYAGGPFSPQGQGMLVVAEKRP